MPPLHGSRRRGGTAPGPCDAFNQLPEKILLATFAYWTGGAAVLIVGAWMVCPSGECAMNALDRAGLEFAHGLRTPMLDAAMHAITWGGSLWLLLPLTTLVLVGLTARGTPRPGVFLVVSLLGASVLSHLVKLFLARPRPALFPPDFPLPLDWSYPSAHTMQAFALAVAWLLLSRSRHPLRVTMLLIGASLVGFSRVYLQVHYPSDVIAGMLAAGLWVAGLHHGMFRRQARTHGTLGKA
jgi:undecaprenyl-diphosphatase